MRFGFWLLIGFLLLELWLLIKLGGVMGAAPTVLLVVVGAMVGLWLLRVEGLRTWLSANRKLEQGEMPAQEVIEGGLLGLGALLLFMPGLITDVLGLLFLLPPTRHWLAKSALPRRIMVVRPPFAGGFGPQPGRSRDSHTIEGEYRRDD